MPIPVGYNSEPGVNFDFVNSQLQQRQLRQQKQQQQQQQMMQAIATIGQALEKQKQKKSQADLLNKLGVTNQIQPTAQDYINAAQKKGMELNLGGTPEEQLFAAQKLMQSKGVNLKPTTQFDISKIPAGMEIPDFMQTGMSVKGMQPQYSQLLEIAKAQVLAKYTDPKSGIPDFSKMNDEEKRFVGALPSQNIFTGMEGLFSQGGTTPPQQAKPNLPTMNNELVMVTNPQGKKVNIKKSQLPDALKQGYKQ